MLRHNNIRDGINGWLTELGRGSRTERHIPYWVRPDKDAILDVVYVHKRLGEGVCVDVTVVDSAFAGAPTSAAKALPRREREQHRRYPGKGIFAFVLDTRGRWGREAQIWARSVVADLPEADRKSAVRRLRMIVGRALLLAVGTSSCRQSAAPQPRPARCSPSSSRHPCQTCKIFFVFFVPEK